MRNKEHMHALHMQQKKGKNKWQNIAEHFHTIADIVLRLANAVITMIVHIRKN